MLSTNKFCEEHLRFRSSNVIEEITDIKPTVLTQLFLKERYYAINNY